MKTLSLYRIIAVTICIQRRRIFSHARPTLTLWLPPPPLHTAAPAPAPH
jgi:hypothetical protein